MIAQPMVCRVGSMKTGYEAVVSKDWPPAVMGNAVIANRQPVRHVVGAVTPFSRSRWKLASAEQTGVCLLIIY